jgi:hypothetical protein
MGEFDAEKILKPDFVARHYRGIIISLVLVNIALIVFLIVYIWVFSPVTTPIISSGEPVAVGLVRADRLIMWSEPGGLEQGAESRGVVEKGSRVQILQGRLLDQQMWLEVIAGERRGWIPDQDVDYRSDGLP